MSTTKVVPGMLVALPSAQDVAREAGSRIGKAIREAIRARGRASVALSGGETPRATYAALANEKGIAWSQVDVLFVDERAVSPESARSNYKLAKETLLDPANVPENCVFRMPADEKDLDAAAKKYEDVVRAKAPASKSGIPSIDVMTLGIGDDGHTASLFPGEGTVDVRDRLVLPVASKGEREARLTLTTPIILETKLIFILAVGAKKTPMLEAVWSLQGSRQTTPARIVREVRGGIVWIIDKAAGGLG